MRVPLVAALMACLAPQAAVAQQVLDDSASPVQQVRTDLDWATPLWQAKSATAREFTRMQATVPNLDIRLDTSDYTGRRADVYMTIPLPVRGVKGSQGMRVTWRSEGLFEDGTLVPGQRALVYSGPIEGNTLRDRLRLTIELDSEALTGAEVRFEPEFRIEGR